MFGLIPDLDQISVVEIVEEIGDNVSEPEEIVARGPEVEPFLFTADDDVHATVTRSNCEFFIEPYRRFRHVEYPPDPGSSAGAIARDRRKLISFEFVEESLSTLGESAEGADGHLQHDRHVAAPEREAHVLAAPADFPSINPDRLRHVQFPSQNRRLFAP